ncbi:MAG: hypothetical protein IKL89_00830 [Clostridia bacterium]|nr:hypothetical protein [Clostridia bacterium]
MSDRTEEKISGAGEKEFVLEDILREFHTDETFVPAPPEPPLPPAEAPAEEIKPSLLDETFDAEMEQSLQVIFGKKSEAAPPQNKTTKPPRLQKLRRRAADPAEAAAPAEAAEEPVPFSSDIFNEAYEESRTEPEEESHRTTTIRLRRHGMRDTQTLRLPGGEGMERLGEGRSADPHVDPEALLAAMSRALRSVHSRLPIVILLCLPLLYLTLALPLGLPLPAFLSYIEHPFVYVFTQLLFMIAVGIAGLDILTNGFYCLFCLRPGGDSLIALSYLAAALHCAGIIFFPEWGGYLPVCLLPALSTVFSLLGDRYNLRARILSLRAVLRHEDSECSTLVAEEAAGNRLYLRAGVSGRTAFYDGLNHSDPVSRAMVWFAPAAMILGLICAVICAVRTSPGMFFWAFSMICGITPLFSLYTCCALPYHVAARKCYKHGAAIGNCEAFAKLSRPGAFVVTDRDLYPLGSVKMSGYKMFSTLPKEKILTLTEAAIRASGSSVAPVFADILNEECLRPLDAETVEFSGHGGIRAEIDGYSVMVGTAEFMRKASVELPEGIPTRNTVFVAVHMALAAAFSLRYEHHSRVTRAMDTLVRGGRTPRLASRNFSVTVESAAEGFDFAPGWLSPLSTEEQVALANPDRAVEADAVLFLREGLPGPAVVLECARRYARTARISTLISLIFAFVGCALMCLLTAMGWTSSVTPWHMLCYMLALSLPGWLMGFWVSKF